ncbi:deoxyribonuclease IV [Knoellia koreensis]|uniref:Deoxyribonuclease IV n=1 Tax=Knoellia koreensis TaxID=2730921 RepID=A0A849HDZ9_9MICO|nr:deoxyribonuclease IV [Knoellia sp. DB2414S]NNM46165.1 deoxyribonuclease IV [Knoellia sp. DB2414S]
MAANLPRLGAHVDSADPVGEAQARGAGLSQFFLGNPQSYKGPVVEYAAGPAALKESAEAADVDLYVHAPYLINVASTNNRIRIPSRKLLQQFVDAAAEIGAKGLIVHGGHVENTADVDKGFDNWRKAIEATDLKVPVFLENTAGGDNAMARTLERIARTWEAIQAAPGGDNVGFCLDTCHAWAGGIPLATAPEQIRAITGRIDLVHCNDSRDEFDSGADRHTNLGQGLIPSDELVAAVKAADAPVVIETRGGLEGQIEDLDWLRERLAGA